MGVDLLDITFRIEKTFGIRMPFNAWLEFAGMNRDQVAAVGFDVTAGQIYDFIVSRLREMPDGLHVPVESPPKSFNPNRPGPWSREDVWDLLRGILVDCLGVDSQVVTPDARLMADLGAE